MAALTKADILAFPVWLPDGMDLAEYIIDRGSDGLAHLIADTEIEGENRRNRIVMDEINSRLGRQAT